MGQEINAGEVDDKHFRTNPRQGGMEAAVEGVTSPPCTSWWASSCRSPSWELQFIVCGKNIYGKNVSRTKQGMKGQTVGNLGQEIRPSLSLL